MNWKFPSWRWIADGVRILAPIPLTFTSAGLVLIVWQGGWPTETAEARLQWLGIALLFNLTLLGLALFLSRAGISSFSLKGPGGMEVSVNEKDRPDE